LLVSIEFSPFSENVSLSKKTLWNPAISMSPFPFPPKLFVYVLDFNSSLSKSTTMLYELYVIVEVLERAVNTE